jgi:hypothetical protein
VTNWNSKNYKFAISNLNKDIDPERSYVKATKSGLIVGLKKTNKSDHWDSLEKKKNTIGEDKVKKPKGGEDPSGNLMEMMKEMYQSVILF